MKSRLDHWLCGMCLIWVSFASYALIHHRPSVLLGGVVGTAILCFWEAFDP